ncbi:DUF2946 family protein [Acetobacter fallax]|uniref:DUF2946 domain-containing protein n=1 Tax=Acetobacter fallax TaxID=1737473 RepID=A0ABX0K451_9PROT|nr:DUF2946 family protein [Acetobacter fallax]NHO31111.1 DUF2946 domain-containing protein [Acetobacter fallax]NHO34668.1 DUF2946 domain-containing protein [Acetobacter fallax]
MTVPVTPATRQRCCRWLIVALTLIGLLGQLSLQGLSMPGDTPRATILRLTGIDISPTHNDAGPMSSSMHHHHIMHEQMASGAPHQTHHQHDVGCALCPLLMIFGVILTAAIFLPGISGACLLMRRLFAQPRAPPVFARLLPPLRGPPGLI